MVVMKTPTKEKLYGLVLTGGASKRMKKDKAALRYQGKTQTQRAMDLLSVFCQRAFVSCREEQKDDPGRRGFEQIHDQKPFLNSGPIGGILSAMRKYPKATWLVLGCDLPFVDAEAIKHLLKKRNRQKNATAFRSDYDSLPEPLCAVYEKSTRRKLQQYFRTGGLCPRKFLILNRRDVCLIKQKKLHWLDNINEPAEYKKAVARIKSCD